MLLRQAALRNHADALELFQSVTENAAESMSSSSPGTGGTLLARRLLQRTVDTGVAAFVCAECGSRGCLCFGMPDLQRVRRVGHSLISLRQAQYSAAFFHFGSSFRLFLLKTFHIFCPESSNRKSCSCCRGAGCTAASSHLQPTGRMEAQAPLFQTVCT